MPELRHLRYFVAVAEELNFSRAAERLHMAQPPLSVAIRQLEDEIGAQLLQRTSREVRLTAAGRAALTGAYRTLAAVDRTMLEARRAAAGELGALRVAFSWSARFETLPVLGRAFRARRPDVELLTEEMWNARMAPALRAGAIDLAVALCPEVDPELSYATIRSEPVVALLAATHPLAQERSLALSALAEDGFVLFPRELAPRLHDVLVGMCRRAGFEPMVRSQSFHSGWELRILADVSVVSLAPASVALALAEGLAAVALADPYARLETAVVWSTDDADPACEAFREVAGDAFADGASGGGR